MTKAQRKALEIIVIHGRPITPGRFAELMWPDSPSWKHRTTVGRNANGSAVGVGIRQRAGSFLAKMAREGLVKAERHESGHYLLYRVR